MTVYISDTGHFDTNSYLCTAYCISLLYKLTKCNWWLHTNTMPMCITCQ